MGWLFKSKEERAAEEAERQAEQKRKEEERKAEEAQKEAQRKVDLDELKEKLKQSPLMAALMLQLESEPWTLARQSGDDYGRRDFEFTPDGLSIIYSDFYQVEKEWYDKIGLVHYDTEWKKKIVAQVAYSYTKSGYAPLSAYKSIPAEDVLTYWKFEWEDRMKKRVPGIRINYDYYKLPAPTKQAF